MCNWIKKHKSLVIVISVSIAIMFAILSLLYDYCKNKDCVTMIAGLWSAAATAAVGGIAYWQNKNYKLLSDQQNDLAFMPELYISTAFEDSLSNPLFSRVRGALDGIETITCAPIKLWILKSPIIDLKVVEIRHKQEHWVCCEKAQSFRDESRPINLIVDIPKKCVPSCDPFTATRYQKKIDFTIEADSTTPDVKKLKKARRIENGQA